MRQINRAIALTATCVFIAGSVAFSSNFSYQPSISRGDRKSLAFGRWDCRLLVSWFVRDRFVSAQRLAIGNDEQLLCVQSVADGSNGCVGSSFRLLSAFSHQHTNFLSRLSCSRARSAMPMILIGIFARVCLREGYWYSDREKMQLPTNLTSYTRTKRGTLILNATLLLNALFCSYYMFYLSLSLFFFFFLLQSVSFRYSQWQKDHKFHFDKFHNASVSEITHSYIYILREEKFKKSKYLFIYWIV